MNQALRVALILAAFVGIFASGAVVGGVVMVHFDKERFDVLEKNRVDEQHRHQQEQRRLGGMIESQRQQMQRQQQQALQAQQRQQLQQRGGPQGARPLTAPEQFGPQLMQRFTNQIRPVATPEQREKIRAMVNQAAEELRRLRRDTAHSTETTLDHLEDEISGVLTPEQRDRFTDAIQRWRDNIQKYNAELQQRQAQARLLDQRRMQQRRQQQIGAGAVPPSAPASSSPPSVSPPAPPPAPASPPPAAPPPAAPAATQPK